MEPVIPQLNAQTMEVLLVAIVLLGKYTKTEIEISMPWIMHDFIFLLRFGVCCLFVYSSASTTISQNCSYIQNPNFPSAYASTSTIAWQINKCATSKIILQMFPKFRKSSDSIKCLLFRYMYNEIGF